MPTPSHHACGRFRRIALIKFSCFGLPSATKMMSGSAAASLSTISAICAESYSKFLGGQCVPTTFRSGNRSRRTRDAPSAVPGSPPSRNTRRPASAAAPLRLLMRLLPATRSGSGVPLSRLAQTSGIPSATTKSASAIRAAKLMSFCARCKWSRLGVTTTPPRPFSSSARIVSMTRCSVTACRSTPPRRTVSSGGGGGASDGPAASAGGRGGWSSAGASAGASAKGGSNVWDIGVVARAGPPRGSGRGRNGRAAAAHPPFYRLLRLGGAADFSRARRPNVRVRGKGSTGRAAASMVIISCRRRRRPAGA